MAKNMVIGYGNVGRLVAAELRKANEAVIVGRHGDAEATDDYEYNYLMPTV